MNAIIPIPQANITVREATLADIPFIDTLQKKQSKNLGFLQLKALEGKIALGQILMAEVAAESIGYVIGQDRYHKRDDLGIIYQMNIAPGYQRGFVASTLLKAMFDRAAYGCRLFCCWCAQDIEANKFWEAMGFVPLAFRAGSEKKDRVHIFWQKRIRPDDLVTPWWYPHKTEGGAMKADRLAFPIPPGTHWSEVKPIRLEGISPETQRALPGAEESHRTKQKKTRAKNRSTRPPQRPALRALSFEIPEAAKPEKQRKEPRAKVKIDPRFVAASREFRDRYLEQVNAGGYLLETAGKYDITRALPQPVAQSLPKLLAA